MRHSTTLLGFATCLFLVAASGCVSLGRQIEGTPLPEDKLAAVKIGATTRQEILTAFGVPTTYGVRDFEGLLQDTAMRYQGQELTIKIDPAMLNHMFIYEFRRVHRNAYVFVFFNYFRSEDRSDRLLFFFDPKGRVAGYGMTWGTKDL